MEALGGLAWDWSALERMSRVTQHLRLFCLLWPRGAPGLLAVERGQLLAAAPPVAGRRVWGGLPGFDKRGPRSCVCAAASRLAPGASVPHCTWWCSASGQSPPGPADPQPCLLSGSGGPRSKDRCRASPPEAGAARPSQGRRLPRGHHSIPASAPYPRPGPRPMSSAQGAGFCRGHP